GLGGGGGGGGKWGPAGGSASPECGAVGLPTSAAAVSIIAASAASANQAITATSQAGLYLQGSIDPGLARAVATRPGVAAVMGWMTRWRRSPARRPASTPAHPPHRRPASPHRPGPEHPGARHTHAGRLPSSRALSLTLPPHGLRRYHRPTRARPAGPAISIPKQLEAGTGHLRGYPWLLRQC